MKIPIKTQQAHFPLQLHTYFHHSFLKLFHCVLWKTHWHPTREHTLFMQRFYRSYAFNHKSMRAQSHILRKCWPHMQRDDLCTHKQSSKKGGRTCPFLLLHCSCPQAVIACNCWLDTWMQFKDHWCSGIRKVLHRTPEKPHQQTDRFWACHRGITLLHSSR